jgi:hypothetical protein
MRLSAPALARLDFSRLGEYRDHSGRVRELAACPGARGSVLVVDRDPLTGGDGRLVAHLAADEPARNAELVCRHYLNDLAGSACPARPLRREDLTALPLVADAVPAAACLPWDSALPAPDGVCFQLRLLDGSRSLRELRWTRSPPQGARAGTPSPVSLRDVIAALEDYEPACGITRTALREHRHDRWSSCASLRAELARLEASPIVLNRLLREAVLATLARGDVSMSEIAMRCGRVKFDTRGNASGETSWLARRIGLLPEGGASHPTPWIHSEVLGLIARAGLGLSPREVEL